MPSERAEVPAAILDLIPGLPDYLTGYGWSLRPYTLYEWYRELGSVTVELLNPIPDSLGVTHLFTDGSCLNQCHPTCRVAAWAVVLADLTGNACAQVLDSGPLPGLIQSAYRAEAFAILRALQVARLQTDRIFIWSDCAAVVSHMIRLLEGREPKPNSPHSDLWNEIFSLLRDFQPNQICIRKVTAHQDLACVGGPLEEWCAIHNAYADQAANWGQWRRPQSFWHLLQRHVAATQACQHVSRIVQRVLLAVSKAAVGDDGDDNNAKDDLGVSPPVPDDAWQSLRPFAVPPAAIRWYGDKVVRLMLSWFWMATHGNPHEVIWMSQFQLYIDFMLSGEVGPTKIDGWRAGDATSHFDLLTVPFQVRARWFSRVLRECLKHHGQGSTYRFCRPI